MADTVFSSLGESRGTTTRHLMHHFLSNTRVILHVNELDRVVDMSKSHPLIRTVILALAASHLRAVSPGAGTATGQQHYHRIAEHFHQQVALEMYRTALVRPRHQVSADSVSALIMAASILNTLAISSMEHEGHDCPWVLIRSREERKKRNAWDSTQLDVLVLLVSFPEHLPHALPFISDLFFRGNADREEFRIACGEQNFVPQDWAEAFDLVAREDCVVHLADNRHSPYASLAMALAHLRELPRGDRGVIYQTFQSLFKMSPGFKDLLCDRDERALWLLAYWLGMMRRLEAHLWWCRRRVEADYQAIVAWLGATQLSGRGEMGGPLWTGMMRQLREATTGTEERHV
jgi:hypothetical protein